MPAAGVSGLRLGPRILRTETAGIAAIRAGRGAVKSLQEYHAGIGG